MTQKLKKEDRELVLRKVLTEAFEKRFYDIGDELVIRARAQVAAEHPRFVELLADEQTKQYVYASSRYAIFAKVDGTEFRYARPNSYGRPAEMPTQRRVDREQQNATESSARLSLHVPGSYGDVFVSTPEIIERYRKTWADYTEAQAKLSALLNSYSTREKLAEDFPEFAKHVPLAQAKIKLPAVIVTDVLAELAVLGVPATE